MISRYCSCAALLFILLMVSGCANKVRYFIDPDIRQRTVRAVAVLPASGDEAAGEGRVLMRKIVGETLARSGFAVSPFEAVDRRLPAGLRGGLDNRDEKSLKAAMKALNVDGLLLITINEWSTPLHLYYGSISIKATFELYNSGGEKVWRAKYGVGESDIDADQDYLKMSLHESYEHMVVNLVDRVIATLPPPRREERRQKGHYDWLP